MAATPPTFQQSRPIGPEWILQNDDKTAPRLLFRHATTGEAVEVPSIWYNQPASWRAEAMRFYAARADEAAAWLRSGNGPAWVEIDANRQEATAKRLRALADTMEQTGQVLA